MVELNIEKKDALQFIFYSVFVLGIGLSTGTLLNINLDPSMKILIGQGVFSALVAGVLMGYKVRGDTQE